MRAAAPLALLLAACNNVMLPPADPDESTGSSTDASSSTSGESSGESGDPSSTSGGSESTGAPSTSGDGSSSGEATTSSSTGEATSGGSTSASTGDDLCGNGIPEPGEQCDHGQETKLCDADCSVVVCGDAYANEAAGEECDDGNTDEEDGCRSTCQLAGCGDAFLDPGEECDDGNDAAGDGCSDVCVKERWSHVGVADNVAVAELDGWEPCWSDTYAGAALAADVVAACEGDHILIGCRKVGSGSLQVAGHAPRSDVFFEPEPDFTSGEYHQANAIDWYWSPAHGATGFAAPGEGWCGDGVPTQSGMCLFTLDLAFDRGFCGNNLIVMFAEAQAWEHVVFQAWD